MRQVGALGMAILLAACGTTAGTRAPDRIGPCTLLLSGPDGENLESPYTLKYPEQEDEPPPEIELGGTGWSDEHITFGQRDGLPRTVDADLDRGARVPLAAPGQWILQVTGNACHRQVTVEVVRP